MGRYISTTGTAGAVIREVTENFDASVNDRILADSTGGAFTVTLPATGTLLVNDTLQIIDVGGDFANNEVTLSRNGSLISGDAEDLTLDLNGTSLTLMYSGSSYGWIIIGT